MGGHHIVVGVEEEGKGTNKFNFEGSCEGLGEVEVYTGYFPSVGVRCE